MPLISKFLFSRIFLSCPWLSILLNWHRQVFGEARSPCMQMGDRPWAKEPASVPWAQRRRKEREWRVRGGLCLCSFSTPLFPSPPAGLPHPAPGRSFCAPGSLPRRPRDPHCTPTSQPLAPEDPGCETRPAGRPRGRHRAASEGRPRRAPTWSGRLAGKRSAGPGSSRRRLHRTLACGGDAGRQARRVRLPRLRTPSLQNRCAREVDRCGRGAGRSARPSGDRSSIGHSPLYKGGRSSEPGRRTSEQSAPRAGGRGAQGTRRSRGPGCALGAGPAPPRGPGLTTRARRGHSRSLLQEAGLDSPESLPIPTFHDSGWKLGMGRWGGSQEIVFRWSLWRSSRGEGSRESRLPQTLVS